MILEAEVGASFLTKLEASDCKFINKKLQHKAFKKPFAASQRRVKTKMIKLSCQAEKDFDWSLMY